MNGIDIFNGSEVTDWNAIKASGVEYVYFKATEGLTFNDSKMREFYEQAKKLGLKIGFYHFLRRNNTYQEAQHFIDMIAGLPADCKYMIDVEAPELQKAGMNETSTRVRQFFDYMASKGYECGVYTYTSFFKRLFDNRVKGLPLWIAEYGVSKPNINVPYAGFQYSETGSVPGISGNVDLDNFNEEILLGGQQKVELPSGFNEAYYLQENEDVAQAVAKGQFKNGSEHYLKFGYKENRKCVPKENISYASYIQNIGMQDFVSFNQTAGTVGKGLRMEGLTINYQGKGTLTFQAHVQDMGWQSVRTNGEVAGTMGQSKRIEAVKINLGNSDMKLSYSAHIQGIGWMPYVSSGEIAGTVGKGLRLEALKIKLS